MHINAAKADQQDETSNNHRVINTNAHKILLHSLHKISLMFSCKDKRKNAYQFLHVTHVLKNSIPSSSNI